MALSKRKPVCLPFYHYGNHEKVSFEYALLAAAADNKAKFYSWSNVIRSKQCFPAFLPFLRAFCPPLEISNMEAAADISKFRWRENTLA